jgi:pyruvate dehydrogenase E1 component
MAVGHQAGRADRARHRDRPPVAEGPVPQAAQLDVLDRIQRRVLWLAVRMVHEANAIRPNPDGVKVGGHQASSASVVSILTALYFGGWLRAGDRVSIKPHASPVFHAAQYLLGKLDRGYLTTLRAFGGLQAYPSRTKDPDGVDFSTGSVGLGAVAPVFAALTDRYVASHFRSGRPDPNGSNEAARPARRFVGLVGDAELDEGSVWEAIGDETVRGASLGNLLWIVDLNRQSLDRVIPGIKVHELEALFDAVGWQVLEAKYGRRLQVAFARAGGVALRRRIDDMSNEEYQDLLRVPPGDLRQQLVERAPAGVRDALAGNLADTPDAELPALIGDLGGHDLGELLRCLSVADATVDRPTVLFAYTMKGWGLPFAGDPLNHSALLTPEQIEALRDSLAIPSDDEWACFPSESAEGQLCAAMAARLYPTGSSLRPAAPPLQPDDVPLSLPSRQARTISSQEVFGNTLVDLSRAGGVLAQRIVTTSPDVTISTNLGGWVNRVGVWAANSEASRGPTLPRLLRWEQSPTGQHLELGISEMNLFMLLGQLGLSRELNGELVLPVGTLYDPFVCRGLDALVYSIYSGSKFVFAGTPAGVTLSPEGGAHQSTITPSIGLELPNLRAYEPCYGLEVQWCLLEGVRQCLNREAGESSYLRLSTRPIEQAPFEAALGRLGEAQLRAQVLAGAYRLLEPDPHLADAPHVTLAAAGAIVPDVLAAAAELSHEGVAATVLNITSAERLYHAWQSSRLRGIRTSTVPPPAAHLRQLVSAHERRGPLVTVLDGASHTLAFLGTLFGQHVVPLGVDRFGQSGARADLYAYAGIDRDHIVNAALLALAEQAEPA